MSRRHLAPLLLVLALGGAVAGAPDARAQAQAEVLVVGDSLQVLSSPYLPRYLPSVRLTVNVKGGYSSIQIFRLFQEAYNPSQSVIVFDAGTNDNPAYPQILASRLQAVSEIVGDRCLVVPTIHGLSVNGVGNAGKNRVVREFAASRPGTQTPDWAGAVAAYPELMQPDNLHPIAEGADLRARLIAEGVTACLNFNAGFGAPLQQPPSGAGAPNRPRRGRGRGRDERPPPEKPPKELPPPELEDASPVLLDQPVEFMSGGTRLGGELITPAASGRHPAVVMLQGSGPSTRESYREQAEYLARNGVGALIYDKRGSGESGGDPDYRYSQLAEDGRAAVELLAGRSEVEPGGIGLWGLGEGASIAPMVAAGNEDVAALMAVSPSVIAPASQREWAVRRQLRASGTGTGVGAISTFYAVAADAGTLVSDRAADLSFDPVPTWRRVAQPVLAVWGGEDRIVPTRASAAALASALENGANEDRSFRTFPRAAHNLGVAREAFRPGSAPGFKALSAEWLHSHLSEKRPKPTVATALPPADAIPVHAVADPSPLDRWPVQLAWLLLPALALAVHAVRELRRRRRGEEEDATPSSRTWWWLGGVVAVDVLALCALAYAVASIVEVDGQGVAAVAGTPLAIAVAWLFTATAAVATVLLTRRTVLAGGGLGRNPATTVSLVSWVWLLLAVYWLV